MVSSHCASLVSSALAVYRIPALFTKTSRPPRRRVVSPMRRSHAPSARRSAGAKSAKPPAARMASTTAAPRRSSRPDTMTLAPDAANTCAQASPIPVVEPVTRTTFPAKLMMFLPRAAPLPRHYSQAINMSRDPKHDVLFEPVTIGPKQLRNRFWQTSHCAGPGAERPGAQAHLRGMKAEGGWGAVFTEFCSIHPESDEYPYTSARIWDQGDVLNMGYMCEVTHKYGSLAGIQLWYSGGNAPSLESREFGRAPSQWLSPIFATRSVYGCEMDDSDIRAVINMYVEAGKRAEQAGFDLLEVSAGDDTLPMQFLEPRFNNRTDEYGGSFANRSRFFIEMLHALMRALGAGCGITTRFEIDTLHGSEGVEAHEDGVRMLEQLRSEDVIDAVALKIGDYAEWGEDAAVSRFRKSGWMTPFIKQGKAILGTGIPVVGNGRLTSPDDMDALIRAGALDIIG